MFFLFFYCNGLTITSEDFKTYRDYFVPTALQRDKMLELANNLRSNGNLFTTIATTGIDGFYRVFRMTTGEPELPDHIQRCGYHPDQEKVQVGRLNKKGEQVIYGATHKETCLKEVDAKINEKLILVLFKTKSRKEEKFTHIDLSEQCIENFTDKLKQMKSEEIVQENQQVYRFFVDQLCTKAPSDECGKKLFYDYTSSLANLMKSDLKQPINCWIYPSIAMEKKYEYENIMIYRDTANEYFKVGAISQISYDGHNLKTAKQIDKEGKIYWD